MHDGLSALGASRVRRGINLNRSARHCVHARSPFRGYSETYIYTALQRERETKKRRGRALNQSISRNLMERPRACATVIMRRRPNEQRPRAPRSFNREPHLLAHEGAELTGRRDAAAAAAGDTRALCSSGARWTMCRHHEFFGLCLRLMQCVYI